MTRQQVLRDYIVKNGVIHSPGKFEMGPVYAPYFYGFFVEGLADSDNGHIAHFKVTREDKAEFPELKRRHWVSIREDSQGFVRCS